jgi:outer membrane protein
MKHIPQTLRLAALAGLLLASGALRAAETNPWSVRLRATYLDMADKSDAFTALSINFPSNAVHVNSKLIPEFDISYAFTNQFSAELVLTIPQTQDVTLQGVGKLGTFKHLPPTLLAQYKFITPSAALQPYVGAGVNYTLIWGTSLSVAGVPLALEHNSIGLALQAGCDYDLGGDKFINVDVKYVGLQSDVKAGGARLTTAKLDPWLFSLGYGWKF